MKKILIYQDYVESNNNAHLLVAFQIALPNAQISFCDVDDIVEGCLTFEVDLFVIPGGEDLYFCEALNGLANIKIKNYVEQGGLYLGICGGSYYACSHIEWKKGCDDEICEPRELSFYEGTAHGPIYEFLEKNNPSHSWEQVVHLAYGIEEKKTGTTLYRAGPFFSEPKKESQTIVLARYADLKGMPPAILSCCVGKGIAILSAVHIECPPSLYKKMIYKHKNDSYQWQSDRLIKYEKEYHCDRDLFHYVLDVLDNVLNET